MLSFEGLAYIITAEIDDEHKFLSRFWDVSNNMWIDNWRETQFFETRTDAIRAFKSLERFNLHMFIHEVRMSVN